MVNKSKILKKSLSVLLSTLMILSCFGAGFTGLSGLSLIKPTTASADINSGTWTTPQTQHIGSEYAYASGKCGDNLTWSYTKKHVLTITGTGDMWTDHYTVTAGDMDLGLGGTGVMQGNTFTSYGDKYPMLLFTGYVAIGADLELWSRHEEITKIVIGEGVTSIAPRAFYACKNATTITLPSTLESVGEYAFANCSSAVITYPASLESVGDYAFANTKGAKNGAANLSNLEEVGYLSFYNAKLGNVTLGEGLTDIPGYAFANAGITGSLKFSSNLSFVGPCAFINNSITGLDFSGATANVGLYSFYGLSNLKSLSNDENATYGKGALYGAGIGVLSIAKIHEMIGDRIYSDGNEIISEYKLNEISQPNCTSNGTKSSSIVYQGYDIKFKKIEGYDDTYPVESNNELNYAEFTAYGVNTWPWKTHTKQAFSLFTTKVIVRPDVKPVNGRITKTEVIVASGHSFVSGSEILKVTQAEDAKKIVTTTTVRYFTKCSKCGYVKSEYTKDEVTTEMKAEEVIDTSYMNETAVWFGPCGDNVNWYMQPDGSVTIKGTGNMWDFNKDTPWLFSSSVHAYTVRAYDRTNNIIVDWNTDTRKTTGRYTTTITLPSNTTKVTVNGTEYTTFNTVDSHKELTLLTWNDTVNVTANIGDEEVVSNFKKTEVPEVKSIAIENGVTSIGAHAFDADMFDTCDGLGTLVIPESVTSIGNYAFRGSLGQGADFFETIKIKGKVATIGDYAFVGVAEIPENLEGRLTRVLDANGGVYAFDGVNYIGDYAFYFSNFPIKNIDASGTLKHIGSHAFEYASFMQNCSYYLPVIEYIGDAAFKNTTHTFTLSGLKQLEYIGDSAFEGANLTGDVFNVSLVKNSFNEYVKVYSSENLKHIGSSAFKGTKIASITLNPGLEEIGTEAFRGLTSLKKVVFPASNGLSIKENIVIGDLAFFDCVNVTGTDSKLPLFGSSCVVGECAFHNYGTTANKTRSALLSLYNGNTAMSGQATSCIILQEFTGPHSAATCIDKETYESEYTCNDCYATICPSEVVTVGDYGEHQFNNWRITKVATATEAGIKQRNCVICNLIQEKPYYIVGIGETIDTDISDLIDDADTTPANVDYVDPVADEPVANPDDVANIDYDTDKVIGVAEGEIDIVNPDTDTPIVNIEVIDGSASNIAGDFEVGDEMGVIEITSNTFDDEKKYYVTVGDVSSTDTTTVSVGDTAEVRMYYSSDKPTELPVIAVEKTATVPAEAFGTPIGAKITSVEFNFENEKVADYDETAKTIRGLRVGETKLTVTALNIQGTKLTKEYKVVVTSHATPTDFTVLPIEMERGETVDINDIITFSPITADGTPVVAVLDDGILSGTGTDITGEDVGETDITVTVNGITKTVHVTVIPKQVKSYDGIDLLNLNLGCVYSSWTELFAVDEYLLKIGHSDAEFRDDGSYSMAIYYEGWSECISLTKETNPLFLKALLPDYNIDDTFFYSGTLGESLDVIWRDKDTMDIYYCSLDWDASIESYCLDQTTYNSSDIGNWVEGCGGFFLLWSYDGEQETEIVKGKISQAYSLSGDGTSAQKISNVDILYSTNQNVFFTLSDENITWVDKDLFEVGKRYAVYCQEDRDMEFTDPTTYGVVKSLSGKTVPAAMSNGQAYSGENYVTLTNNVLCCDNFINGKTAYFMYLPGELIDPAHAGQYFLASSIFIGSADYLSVKEIGEPVTVELNVGDNVGDVFYSPFGANVQSMQVVSDNNDVLTYNTLNDKLVGLSEGTANVAVTATDESGNSVTKNYRFHVSDTVIEIENTDEESQHSGDVVLGSTKAFGVSDIKATAVLDTVNETFSEGTVIAVDDDGNELEFDACPFVGGAEYSVCLVGEMSFLASCVYLDDVNVLEGISEVEHRYTGYALSINFDGETIYGIYENNKISFPAFYLFMFGVEDYESASFVQGKRVGDLMDEDSFIPDSVIFSVKYDDYVYSSVEELHFGEYIDDENNHYCVAVDEDGNPLDVSALISANGSYKAVVSGQVAYLVPCVENFGSLYYTLPEGLTSSSGSSIVKLSDTSVSYYGFGGSHPSYYKDYENGDRVYVVIIIEDGDYDEDGMFIVSDGIIYSDGDHCDEDKNDFTLLKNQPLDQYTISVNATISADSLTALVYGTTDAEDYDEVNIVCEDTDVLNWTGSSTTGVGVLKSNDKCGTSDVTVSLLKKGNVVAAKTVKFEVIHMSSPEIEANDMLLSVGETSDADISVTNADPADTSLVSNDNSIVAVTDNGLLSAVAPGTATITAENNGVTDDFEVTVVDVTTSVESAINVGDSTTIEVEVLPESTDNNVDSIVTPQTKIVSVSTSDLEVTGLKEGTAKLYTTVTVTKGDLSKEIVKIDEVQVNLPMTHHDAVAPTIPNGDTAGADGNIEYWTDADGNYYISDGEGGYQGIDDLRYMDGLNVIACTDQDDFYDHFIRIHAWTDTWTWDDTNPDNVSASVEFECGDSADTACEDKNFSSAKTGDGVKVTSVVTTPAGCTTAGVKTYTATKIFEGKTYTSTHTVGIPAGHDWGIWTFDAVTKQHTRVCNRDNSHTETFDCTFNSGEPSIDATCTTSGTMVYTCTVCGGFYEETIPATGHKWNTPTFSWTGCTAATATRTCKNNASHTDTVTCVITSEITTPVTPGNTGVRTYTAVATFTEADSTKTVVSDTKTEVIYPVLVASIDASDIEVYVGEYKAIDATVTPADATEKSLTYSGDDDTVATVDSNTGVVTGVSEGTITVTITSDNGTANTSDDKTETITVTVKPVKATAIAGEAITVEKGDSKALDITFTPSDTTHKNLTFISNDSSIASVEADNKIKGVEIGTTTITVIATQGTVDTSDDVETTITVTVIEKTHVHDYEVTTIAPKCTEKGYDLHTCKDTTCGYSYKDNYKDELGHSWNAPVFTWTSDTTCAVTRECGRCHTIETLTANITSSTVPSTCKDHGKTTYTAAVTSEGKLFTNDNVVTLGLAPHTLVNDAKVEPTCTAWGSEAGKHCTVCTYTEGGAKIAPLNHDYKFVKTVAPTCTEQGYDLYECVRHDDSYKTNFTNPKDHTWGTWTPDGDGTMKRECSACHTTEKANCTNCDKVVTAPKCTEKGYTTYKCKDCGNTFIRNYVDSLGHAWVETGRTNETAPDCTHTGGYDVNYECTRCHIAKTEHVIIKALGHVDENNDMYCDKCGELCGGTGGYVVFGKGGNDIFRVSENGTDYKLVYGNNTYYCESGILYLSTSGNGEKYKILVNGNEIPADENGISVTKINGGEVITIVNVVVPDVQQSLTLIEKIAQFFQKIAQFFKNLFNN